MTDIYYCVSDGTNTLYFIPRGTNPTHTRDIWEQPFPFVREKWLMDQVSTSVEIAQPFLIKPGTGTPYATMAAAITAIVSLMPDERTTGWSLKGGDWNGATWAYNANYPNWGTGTYKLINGTITYTLAPGENFTNGDITGSITAKLGMVI